MQVCIHILTNVFFKTDTVCVIILLIVIHLIRSGHFQSIFPLLNDAFNAYMHACI